MSSTEQRRAANRTNALKSTGPVTASGKSTASQNAVRHGLLSARLLLDDESPGDFEALQRELQSALGPLGHLELSLVERIAITLWRQRRLVTAETSAIALSRAPRKIAAGVSTELGLGYGSELKAEDLGPFDQDRIAWCRTVLNEVETLEQIDPVSLAKLAPAISEQLRSDAEEDGESVETFLGAQEKGITGYVAGLIDWCHEQIKLAENRPAVLALAAEVRARRMILPDGAIAIFSRYQSTLDNQLYKALRALRETQVWRLKTLDAGETATHQGQDKAA